MGTKGDRRTGAADVAATDLVDRIGSVAEVTQKKMFGGVGIFAAGVMFGIVDSGGAIFLRKGEGNAEIFEAAGSQQHGRMPYFSVPAQVMRDDEALDTWAAAAAAVAHAARKK